MTGPVPVKETFNYDMFGWQRLVAAPVVIVCGIIIEVLAIMRKGSGAGDCCPYGNGSRDDYCFPEGDSSSSSGTFQVQV